MLPWPGQHKIAQLICFGSYLVTHIAALPGGCVSSCVRANHHQIIVQNRPGNPAFDMEEHFIRFNFVQFAEQHVLPREQRFPLTELNFGAVGSLRYYAYGATRPGHFFLDITLDHLPNVQRYFADRRSRLNQFQIEVSLFRVTTTGQIGPEIQAIEAGRPINRWTRTRQGYGDFNHHGQTYDGTAIQMHQRQNGEVVGSIAIRWQITYRLVDS